MGLLTFAVLLLPQHRDDLWKGVHGRVVRGPRRALLMAITVRESGGLVAPFKVTV
jgi:hypothetical protein